MIDNKTPTTEKDFNEKALKHLIGKNALMRIAEAILLAYPEFDKQHWMKLGPELDKLELKPRVHLLRDELKKLLPQNYSKALKILIASVKDEKLKGFELWPYTEFVQTYGLDELKKSLDALKIFTTLFTAEWAVRPFIKQYPQQTMQYLEDCVRHKNVHVRRWASEGTRPRLPWGERLQDFVRDPSPTLPILDLLKFDEELYVRKSVANHLNDIAKDHPELVVEILAKWKKTAGEKHAVKIDWIISRSLRTLIKNGHPEALNLIGVLPNVSIELSKFKIHQKAIKIGERIDFEFEIRSLSKKSQKIVVDYIVHFVKANSRSTPKVFKLKTTELDPLTTITLSKSHHFKKITTREFYAGQHFLEIQINGKVLAKGGWKLNL